MVKVYRWIPWRNFVMMNSVYHLEGVIPVSVVIRVFATKPPDEISIVKVEA
jgi:hypothetical protein